ncbi:MAG TPA: TIGR03067 domain-containing protein, partial [Chloroflexota bacterium]|nr:TIGR03067 domain-containing protein [Chloroflexota bacterium]
PACQVVTEPAGKTDLEKWQGTWVEATCEWKGEDVGFNDQRPRWIRAVKGNRSLVMDQDGGAIHDLTFSLKPGQAPRAIDIHVIRGPDSGQTNLGIYQFDGDNLKICWTIAGQERPTVFTTKRGTGICFQTWKRTP